jgi:hypothetical protein
MNTRLSRLLADVESANLDSDRLTVYDAVLPSDSEEYQSTGGYGLLLVSAATRDKTEIPIARVYALVAGKVTPLTRIASQLSLPTGPRGAVDITSMSREDSFYLLPVDVATAQGVLLADFSAHRAGFTVGALPVASNDAIAKLLSKPATNLRPDAAAIRQFLDQEYQGFSLNFDDTR